MQSDDRPCGILVVDDNDDIREMVKTTLEAAGYAVSVAADGVSGLAFFQQNRLAVALLLTDVAMPQMNGLELADRVLDLDNQLPILFMSGADVAADRGYGCVAKPFQGSELIARVGVALQRLAA